MQHTSVLVNDEHCRSEENDIRSNQWATNVVGSSLYLVKGFFGCAVTCCSGWYADKRQKEGSILA